MQGQLSKHRTAPSIPSVIAQLFAPEERRRPGRAGSLSKQTLAPAGRSWLRPSSAEAPWGLEQRGPGEEVGEATVTGFFQTWAVAGQGGGANALICLTLPIYF